MHTKKKILSKNASREQANHRSCRQQKKMASTTEKKDTELITSSAKKQRNAGIRPGKSRGAEDAKNLKTSFALSQDHQEICLVFENTFENEPSEDSAAQCVLETIFSPTFHLPKDVCRDVADRGEFTVLFRRKDPEVSQDNAVEDLKIDNTDFGPATENQQCANRLEAARDEKTVLISGSSKYSDKQHSHSRALPMKSSDAESSCDEEYTVLGNLSSEVSAIYLAMQHSKLQCVDETNHESVSTDCCVESDEDDECGNFDPYLFIKNLPELSAVVPTFRPMLLPKQTRSCPSTMLVLDLDETLVHSTLEPCQDADFTFPVNFNFKDQIVYVRCRPYLKDFMERVSSLFEITIFTASQSIYAEKLLNILDPKRKLFRHRVYRESCVYVEGNFLKDLSVLGRDLAHVIIIDNSPQAFGFQVDNGIPIESWFDDRTDRELPTLIPFLESLVGVDDVRPVIAKTFSLRQKVASAGFLSI